MARPTRKSAEERAIFGRADRAETVNPNIVKVHSVPPPQTIENDPDKVAIWNFITLDLAKRQLLSESYTHVIEILVNNVHLYNQYQPALEEAGPLIPVLGKDGETVVSYKENPIFSMVKRIESTILKHLEKLGLTPRDIIYLSNPDAKAPIDVAATDAQKRISYFR